jgi:hypothetical protein
LDAIVDRYRDDYQLLGIRPGDSWQKLRSAYRSQMRRWHPDRFDQNDDARRQAEERSKRINRAYQELSDFYRQHGKLPLDPVAPSVRQAAPNHPPPAATTPPSSENQPHDPRWPKPATPPRSHSVDLRRGLFITALLALAASLLFWEPDVPTIPRAVTTPAVSSPPAPGSAPGMQTDGPTPAAGPTFNIGSTLGEVYSIQGVPDKVEGAVWHYGDARVYFINGRVTRWTHSENLRLKVPDDSHPDRGAKPTAPTPSINTFGRGATKDEVRAVQGTPLRESGDTWDYGLSRVYFDRAGRVSGWQESPLDPLRIKR